MSLTSIRSAAGIALLAVLAAGCGTAAASHPAAPPRKASPTVAASHPAVHSKVNLADRHRRHHHPAPVMSPAAPAQTTMPATQAPAPAPTTQAPAPPPTTTAPAPPPTTQNPIPQHNGDGNI
jgi:hypothetical protein